MTLILQHVTGLLLLAFSVLSFLIARRGRGESRQHIAWWYTTLLFSLVAVTSVIQMIWGTLAVFLGSEHHVWAAYLRIAPAANHGRIVALFVFYVFCAVLAFRAHTGTRDVKRHFAPALIAGFAAGAIFGLLEGELQAVRHYSVTAVLDAISVIAMGAVLLLTLARNTFDRYLWAVLAINGIVSVVAVLWFAAFAWKGQEGAWWPSHLWILFARNGGLALMIVLAWKRYMIARSNGEVPGFFGDRNRTIAIG